MREPENLEGGRGQCFSWVRVYRNAVETRREHLTVMVRLPDVERTITENPTTLSAILKFFYFSFSFH